MSIYRKRLRRLGTRFSLLSLSEKLLSVQATKLRHNIFSGTNFLAIVANFCSVTSSLLLRIYCLIFAANLLSEKHQFTFLTSILIRVIRVDAIEIPLGI